MYDSGTREVFVANMESDTVSVISDTNNTVVATVAVGASPNGVTYDSGTGEVFVANSNSNNVSVISDTNNTVVATVAVGASPNGVTYDSGRGEVFGANAGSDTVSIIAWVYPVTFSESGVPSGQTFQVMVNGASMPLTTDGATDSVSVGEPNGTYAYSVADISGWHQSTLPYSGNVVVSGAAVKEPTLVFTQVTYLVAFSENGLSAGATWYVNFTSGPSGFSLPSGSAAAGSSISLFLANGTYEYTVTTNVNGFQTATPEGLTESAGAPPSVAVTFAPTYSITFTETGLPSGTSWSVTLNGATSSSTTSTITFTEANGTYSYTVGTVSGYTVAPLSGMSTVNGASVSQTITFTPMPTYSVGFTESGLASGTSWSVTLNGATQSSVSSSATFSEPNGTYSYSLSPIAGYAVSPSSGTITVSGSDQSQAITFTATPPSTYTVTFTQTGLSSGTSGTSWSVTFNGVAESGTGTSIVFTGIANGTYTYSIGTVSGYTVSPSSGMVTVNGANVNQGIAFTAASTLHTAFISAQQLTNIYGESYTGTGIENGSSVLGGAGLIAAESQGYGALLASVVVSIGLYNSVGNASAEYGAVFSGSGNTSTGSYHGVDYRVVGFGSSLDVAVLTAGTYTFVIEFTYGAVGNSEVSVIQAQIGVMSSSSTFHTVTFTETGLPVGTTWSVTFNGVPQSGTGTSIVFTGIANGTYTYSIGTVSGYTVSPSSGMVTVNGANVNQGIAFTAASTLHTAFISAQQLTNIYGESYTGTGIENGSSVLGGAGLIAAESQGYGALLASVVVSIGLYNSVGNASAEYGAVFSGSGNTSTGSYHGVDYRVVGFGSSLDVAVLTAGTYTFVIEFTYGAVGNSEVSVIQAQIGVMSSSSTFHTVTFTETGLPVGTTWSVTFNGVPQSGTGTSIVFTGIANGTYTYSIGTVSGYTVSPSSGMVTVNGANVNQGIAFTAASTLHTAFISAQQLTNIYGESYTGTGIENGSSVLGGAGLIAAESQGYGALLASVVVSIGLYNSVGNASAEYGAVFSGSGNTSTGSYHGVDYRVVGFGSSLDVAVLTAGTYTFVIEFTYGAVGNSEVSVIQAQIGVMSSSSTFHTVTFTETGLPVGTTWSVTFNGVPQSGTGTSVVFTGIVNGTYSFGASATGYTASPSSGSITVNGTDESEAIAFAATPPSTYTVTFTKTGLSSGTSWSVTLGGSTVSSTADTITFTEPNGTYTYGVNPVGAYYVEAGGNGTFTIHGAGRAFSVTYVFTVLLMFSESGLPGGSSWTVNVTSADPTSWQITSSASSITFHLPANATYSYTITAPSGQSVSTSAGSATLGASGQTVPTISISPSSASSSSFPWTYVIVGVVIAAVVVGIAIGLMRRKPPAASPAV